ncbi:iron chelate uptake ABC transporter family permease subunit [Actinomadura xylanilytica]|uniref:iron chelate uptake ABC transporter family permease subunit n=1 Tax=Actinomadura xylanilytica TaxID=887459 RepID=UPI00255B18ED|nr:iron chelate uptake ABC transporter family permease subunit [Actinomadura xylanilytica]MDL4770561.1 iron chelate uptake ABC transporter family permease subunit [Actinomadura xylanilytica]
MSSSSAVSAAPRATPPAPAARPSRTGGPRVLAVLGGLAALVAALALVSLLVGAGDTRPGQVIGYLLGRADARDDGRLHTVVATLRLPRTLAGLALGAALGLAGALLQAATRNPLAETGLLGVNGGAALGVVVGISAFGAGAGFGYVPWALGGALAASLLVLVLAGAGRAGASPLRLVLAGAAITCTVGGLINFIVLGSGRTYDEYRFWVLGSLAGVTAESLTGVLPVLALGALAALPAIRPLSALSLGDDAARALGHRPAVTRVTVAVAVTLLAAGSVALAGPLTFLGLVAGYAARRLMGPRTRAQLAAAALVGPAVLVAADVVARVLIKPFETSVALVLALIGGPLLIVMVRSRNVLLLGTSGDLSGSGGASRTAPGARRARRAAGPGDSLVLRSGGRSVLIPRRGALAVLGLAALTALVLAGCVVLGSSVLSPADALGALFGRGSRAAVLMVREFGLPRIVAGMLVGAALGAAGCLTQTLARNRLATPDFLGVNEGATLSVLLALAGGAGGLGAWWSGPLGALLAAGLVLLLSGGTGARGYRVLVVGLAVAAILRSLVELLLAKKDLDLAEAMFTWSVGSLNGRGYSSAAALAAGLAVLLPLALLGGRRLRLLRFGEDVVRVLGTDPGRTRLLVLATATALAGLAVGVGGPIGFIALSAPVVAARLTGPARVPLVASALVGAVFVALADTIGRTVMGDTEVPAGAIAGIVAGPFLLYVLLREQRA